MYEPHCLNLAATSSSFSLCANMTSCTKLEIYNISLYCWRRTKPLPEVTCTKIWSQTNTHTHRDRCTHHHTLLPYRGGVINISLCALVLWHCWLDVRKSTWPVKIGWWGVGVVICLEWGTDCLHMVQLMPLHSKSPSSLASFKSRLVLPLWYWITQVVPEKRLLVE